VKTHINRVGRRPGTMPTPTGGLADRDRTSTSTSAVQVRVGGGGSGGGRSEGRDDLPLAILPVGEFSGGDHAHDVASMGEAQSLAFLTARQEAAHRDTIQASHTRDPRHHHGNGPADHDAIRQHAGDGADGARETRDTQQASAHQHRQPTTTTTAAAAAAAATAAAADPNGKHGDWALASLPAGSFGIVPNATKGTLMPAVPFRFLPPNQVRLQCTVRVKRFDDVAVASLLFYLACFVVFITQS
jgi:hypothetical protein